VHWKCFSALPERFVIALEMANAVQTPLAPPDMSSPRSSFANLSFINSTSATAAAAETGGEQTKNTQHIPSSATWLVEIGISWRHPLMSTVWSKPTHPHTLTITRQKKLPTAKQHNMKVIIKQQL
jgi:hypothetical protein